MHDDGLELVVADLEAEEWLQRAGAVRRLFRHPDQAVGALDRLFALTFDAKAPIASKSRLLIKTLGRHAVPFLRDKAADTSPQSREMAIWLLLEAGRRWATTTQLRELILRERYAGLPDWGGDPEEVIALFVDTLGDDSLAVRFAAAEALEEFGREIPQTVPVFVDVLRHGPSRSQKWAALRLGRIGPVARSACNDLRSATRSECPYTALAATNALRSVACDETA
jgi:HEAT repeat protein